MKEKMIDSAKFYCIGKISDFTDRNRLAAKLTEPEETYSYATGETWLHGKVRNMEVREHEHGFYIQGSLPKFYFGNNIQTLNCSQLRDCVAKISDELNLPIDTFGVSRVDITDNVEMKYKPKVYVDCLHSCTRFQKVVDTNGISFRNKSKKLTFYDKIAERTNKRQPVPVAFQNKNLLRYEYRINERISESLGFQIPNITAFYNQGHFTKMIEAWYTQFGKIVKVESSITKVSDMDNQLKYKERNEVEYLLSRGGEGAALDEIELMYAVGRYEYRKQVTREKKRVRRLFEKYNAITPEGYSFKNELCNQMEAKRNENRVLLLE